MLNRNPCVLVVMPLKSDVVYAQDANMSLNSIGVGTYYLPAVICYLLLSSKMSHLAAAIHDCFLLLRSKHIEAATRFFPLTPI